MISKQYSQLIFNLFCILVLGAIFLNAKKRKKILNIDYSFIKKMIFFITLEITLDYLGTLFNGENLNIPLINGMANYLYFLGLPFAAMFWCSYLIKKSCGRNYLTKKEVVHLLIPLILNTLLIISNFWTHIYFSISDTNMYVRSSTMPLSIVIVFDYFLYPIFKLTMNKKRFDKKTFFYLLSYPITVLIATIVQYFIPDLAIMCQFAVISILVFYINVHESAIFADELTTLMTRREFTSQVEEIISRANKKKLYCGMIFDIDGLKYINDHFGHNSGDDAISAIANIIKRNTPVDALACRYGGDELTVVFSIQDEKEIDTVCKKIQKDIDLFNEQKVQKFFLSVSYAPGILNEFTSYSDFIDSIDKKMYEQKKIHHEKLKYID